MQVGGKGDGGKGRRKREEGRGESMEK